jgi:hypothetical protein
LTTHKAGERPAATPAEPLPRWTGTRAEEAWLRARALEAAAADDAEAICRTRGALARWLASRDRDLDEAAELGASALQLEKDDPELRREVSAWLESLGDPARAATVLKTLASSADVDSAEASSVLVRVGLLKARAGAAAAAAAAFEAARSIDGVDANAGELLATMAAWQSEAVTPNVAVEAWLESAERRTQLKQDDAELVNLWRAFTVLPASDKAASALVDALERHGRSAAADDILRAHAQALVESNPSASVRVHQRRRVSATLAREPARALAAALDEGLATQLDGEDGAAFDALLLDLGMLDALAARLELRAERSRDPSERAATLLELARLHSGPLADGDGAATVYAAVLAANPACEEAITALQAWSLLRRGLDTVDSERHSLHELATSLGAVPDEPDRYERVLTHLRTTSPSAFTRNVSPEGRPATERALHAAWVHELFGAGPRGQMGALERAAESGPPAARAAFLAVAADRYLSVGNATAARNAAELATRIDPSSVRAIAALADSVMALPRDRRAAPALERAIAMIGPRAAWCFALADTLAILEDADLAAGWSQQCASLRPGDHEAIALLFERLLRAGDGSRVRDALAWLLAQPQPVAWAAEPFAHALTELGRMDPERALVVARRALDVFGARSPRLRDAMLAAAERASDDVFAIAILERWLSSGVAGADRRQLLLRLADLRFRIGDDEGEARILARAVSEGFVGAEIEERIQRGADRPVSGDALVWRMRANAERLAADNDTAAAASRWRHLGGALWDLAEDRVGALETWQRAAATGGRGYAGFAMDLVEFAGSSFAFRYLTRVVETEPDDDVAADIAADAAIAALSLGEAHFAFDLAARGLARSAGCARALEAAERAAVQTGELPALSALYDLVASRSLGRFGRRAAHYRGARFFERSGQHALALKHAAQAFYAVPSEGGTFQSLARAAERAGDRPLAVHAVEQVAELEPEGVARARWLLCAARIAGEGEDGARRKVDALLRAVMALPSRAAVAELRHAARQLLQHSPDERESLALRFAHASRTMGKRLDGPEGASVSIAFASTLAELFGEADDAMASLERAFACDADLEEYDLLKPHAALLAQGPRASERVADMVATTDHPHTNVGVSALRLLAAIGAAAGSEQLRARCIVAAASRDPDDDALVIEADAAARAEPDLRERLSAAVPPARRAAVLEAAARAHVKDDRHGDAAAFFERAAELLTGEARARVERDLRAALDAAGRRAEIEARAHREAASGGALPSVRADGWTEVAELRESRGDKVGAVNALLEACKLDPEPLQRWSALERVAEIAGDDDARITALQRIETRVGHDGLPTVLKRLARAHERRGNLQTAEQTWRRVLALDAEDDEANQAVQSIIVARGDYSELVDHLAVRAERLHGDPEKREILRALRLRRAAILEQRLGRIEDACHELELLLRDWPDSVGALRYLADLLDRQRDFARSVPLWRRAAELEENPAESGELQMRAASASREALSLRIESARALGADADLGDALDAMAATENFSGTRADLLLESALAADRAGDLARGLDRAKRAVESDAGRSRASLLARSFEYRIRGAGAPDEARQTIQDLGRIVDPLAPDDAAMRAFLLAEALDVVQGGGAGLRELDSARSMIGDHSLVALGRAERLAAQGQDALAVEAYRAALKGTLTELRRPGAVALHAADCALRAGSLADTTQFLNFAERHEDARAGVAQRRARLIAASRSVTPLQVSQMPTDVRPVATRSDVRSAEKYVRDDPLLELEAAVRHAQDPAERSSARLSLARALLDCGDVSGAEPLLWESLAEGSTEAGDLLAPVLASEPARSAELVRVRWQLVALEPGDFDRLESLRAAALAEGDRVHARAVEHVMRAFDPGAGPLPPPPLAVQPEQPGIVALLMRPAMDAAGEALALLWEGAMQLFVRDATSYGITGIERVVPGPTSPLGRLYEVAVRLLGVPRIPVFLTRAPGSPESHVALLSPPSVILSGDVRDESAVLSFEFGRGIASALPHNVLRSALPKGEGRTVLDALRTAFGPPELGRQVDARVARLAESFWQIIPARVQRRLQELLGATAAIDYAELVERGSQSGRRVGMFLAGDFAWTAHRLLAESPSPTEGHPSVENLRALCANVPALADLLCLAVRPEYADARWHTVASASQLRTASSGRFSLF